MAGMKASEGEIAGGEARVFCTEQLYDLWVSVSSCDFPSLSVTWGLRKRRVALRFGNWPGTHS